MMTDARKITVPVGATAQIAAMVLMAGGLYWAMSGRLDRLEDGSERQEARMRELAAVVATEVREIRADLRTWPTVDLRLNALEEVDRTRSPLIPQFIALQADFAMLTKTVERLKVDVETLKITGRAPAAP